MKKLIDLREERNQAIEAMQGLIDSATKETRSMNETELKTWQDHDVRVKALESEIEILQRQEDLNKTFVKKVAVETPEAKIAKRFDLFKAIREVGSRGLTGVEAEICQEGFEELKRSKVEAMPNSIVIPSKFINTDKRGIAYVATADGTPPIKTGASDILSIVRTPLVMDRLGVTFYNDLTGNFKIPRMAQLTAAFVNEEAAVDTGGTALASDTLAPRRVGSGDIFTKELFSQTAPAIQNQILQEFVDAIYRAIQKDLFDAVAAGATAATGSYAITDTVAALTHAALLALEKTIENEYDGMAYACSHAQKAKLKALALGTSIRFAWTDNQIEGYPAYATAALAATNGGSTNTAYDVLFGYWKAAVVGTWGGVELIVDPYTYAENGAYKVTANGLADTGVANALHFSAIRNADA